MMSFIAQAGAVPFGYVSELIDSEVQCPGCNSHQQCLRSSDDRPWHYLRTLSSGLPPLPDLVLSNTPPPSPLRRAMSCPFFPTTTSKKDKEDYTMLPPRTAAKNSHDHCHPACCSPSITRNNSCQDLLELGRGYPCQLNHQRNLHSNSQSHGCSHCHPSSLNCINLPQLLWEIPARARLRQNLRRNGRSHETRHECSQESMTRAVGRDLRKIADRFQLDHGKVTTKNKQEVLLSLAFPEAFTRCLTASVLCLIWWRVFNKFR